MPSHELFKRSTRSAWNIEDVGAQPFDFRAIELDDRPQMFIEGFAVMGARVMQQECNTGEAKTTCGISILS
jgi:hypothetical protein